jgi:hypothetical protein
MGRVLNVLSNLAAGKLERSLKCESCGREFTCGASLKGCWCAEVEVSDEDRASLRARFSDCLCRECLEDSDRWRNTKVSSCADDESIPRQ